MQIMLHAVAGKELDRAVVHVHGEIHREDALDVAQDRAHGRIQIQEIGRPVELSLRDLKRIVARLGSPTCDRLIYRLHPTPSLSGWIANRLIALARRIPRAETPTHLLFTLSSAEPQEGSFRHQPAGKTRDRPDS
jgi:hypothetical protein